MIRIVVDGAPVGKGRPRFFIRRNPVGSQRVLGAQTPTKTVNYEAILAARGAEAMNGAAPLDDPLVVRVAAFMPIPKSWSRKKVAAALEGVVRPGRPDADNIFKMLDALNQIVWRDDAQIAEARLSKLYDPHPRLEIEVESLVLALSDVASDAPSDKNRRAAA